MRVIDAESGEQVLYQRAHSDWVLDTVFSVDGSQLVSVGRDMTAKLIEIATERFIDNITSITPGALKGGIQSVERHPLRDEVLIRGCRRRAEDLPHEPRHRAADRRRCQRTVGTAPLPGRIFSVDITPDGRVIAAGSSLDGHGHVHVYRMEPAPVIPEPIQAILNKPVFQRSEEEKTRLQKHFEQGVQTLARVEVAEGGVYAVALSPNGERVAAAGGDGTVRLIDTGSGSPVTSFVPVEIQKTNEADIAVGNQPTQQPPTNAALDPEPPLPVGDPVVNLTVLPATIELNGPARYAQVIATAELASGAKIDVTRLATFELSAPVATANASGLVTPKSNGHGLLTIAVGDKSASVDVQVAGFDAPPRPDFIRDIAPILARAGCNQGTCHGAQSGKNGFKLSLRGYDPVFDVRALADDLASRRVNVASPAHSLMLLKSTAAVPHQGGQVLKPGSPYYEQLRQWIADGAHA